MIRQPTPPPVRDIRKHVFGIALIEGLIAMAVLVGGVATVLGLHSQVASNSAQNRLSTAAMGVAQGKLEELRNEEFDLLVGLSDSETSPPFTNPGLGTDNNSTLTVCWASTEVEADVLLRLEVSVTRSGEACTPGDASSLATLSTLIARQDPRYAARMADEQRRGDGDARLVRDYEVPDGVVPSQTTGGFGLVFESDGSLAAIFNPDTGDALIPRNEGRGLRLAFINGNLLVNSAKTAEQIRQIRVDAEANAFCRVFYPGSTSSPGDIPPAAPPKISAGTHTLTYVQYSCAVPDQWRRAIIVSPPSDQQVCVGYPGLQPTDEDGSFTQTDALLSQARLYFGSGYLRDGGGAILRDTAGNAIDRPVGMRGDIVVAEQAPRSVIGSLCEEGQPCWNDEAVRGWVPGGHHFFIKPRNDGQICAEAMGILKAIDLEAGLDEPAPAPLYENVVFRNPHRAYCTNEKDFTINELPLNPTAEQLESSRYCYSGTQVSGFMLNNDAELLDGRLIILGSSSRYATPCRPIGPFGAQGGGYMCTFGDDVAEIRVTPFVSNKIFDPASYSGLEPTAIPHDYVLKNFDFLTRAGAEQPPPAEPGDETEPLANCVNGARVTAQVGNNRRVKSISANGEFFSPCNESGSGGNTVVTCIAPNPIAFGNTVSLQWESRQGQTWTSQPDRTVNVSESNLETDESSANYGMCIVTNVSLP